MKPQVYPPPKPTVATVGRLEMGDVQQIDMPKYDPVNYILDKIDYEMYSAERVRRIKQHISWWPIHV